MPQSERTAILEAYADEIGKRTDAIAEAISKDMGKALWESRGEAATMKAKVAVSIAAQVERAGGKVQEA
ncbi:aldehyde dehydrogenase family protein, partial [Hyphomonas sp.]